MKTPLSIPIIFITAAAYAGFGLWLGVQPNALLEAFGIEDRTPAMATEIRAFYGGIELGIAAVMLVLWKQGYARPAMLVGGLPLAGSASGRCIGMLVDGYSGVHAVFAGFEFVGFAFCMLGMFAVRNHDNTGH